MYEVHIVSWRMIDSGKYHNIFRKRGRRKKIEKGTYSYWKEEKGKKRNEGVYPSCTNSYQSIVVLCLCEKWSSFSHVVIFLNY